MDRLYGLVKSDIWITLRPILLTQILNLSVDELVETF